MSVNNAADGTIVVATGELRQDQNTTTTNDGTVTVDATALYNLTAGGASLTNETDGTLAFQIAGAASFGKITLNGSAKLTVAGGSASPILTSGYMPPLYTTEFPVIIGVTGTPGTFTTVLNDFAADYATAGSIAFKRIDATTTSLSVQPNPSTYGQAVTFTATVAPAPGGNGSPTGTVTFTDGSAALGSAAVATSGGATTATFTSSALAAGSHALAATYDGDNNFGASAPSTAVSDTVNRATPAASIAASSAAITAGQSETLTATVTAPPGVSPPPTGQVTFTDGGAALATVALTSSGGAATATLTTTGLAAGAHSLGASYIGDSDYASASAASPASVMVSAPPPPATTTTTTDHAPRPRLAAALPVSSPRPIPKDTRIVPHGTVRVRLPDSQRYIPISEAKTIPLGTTIDATAGQVQIDVATPTGPAIKGELYGGSFVLTESKSGTVIATLTGGNFAVCPANAAPKKAVLVAQIAAKKASPSTVVRKLWANVKGNFTTSGRYASASVRGTQWLTEDRCNGTYVFVAFGAVRVTAFATHRSTLVKTKRSLLVKAP